MIINLEFLKIICCLYLKPLNFLIVLIKDLSFNFNILEIAKINDKFSLFVSLKK